VLRANFTPSFKLSNFSEFDYSEADEITGATTFLDVAADAYVTLLI
jgi:predicted peroxiredoxin